VRRGLLLGRAPGLALGLALAGCSLITDSFVTNDFSGDLYPIQVQTDSGAIVVGLRELGTPDRVAVLDLLSPLTLVDPGIDIPPTVTRADLIVLGERGGVLDLPRARFLQTQVLALHPCQTPSDPAADPTCFVGPDTAPHPFDAIIGADALAGDALRLRLGDHQVSILADVAGGEQQRALACDAVFPSPYRGGGTLVLAGTELPFTGRRVTMQTCLGDNPDPAITQSLRGADALMLISTGIGRSLLGEAAYERYRLAHPAAPALADLPIEAISLPSGSIEGRHAVIDRLAMVARSSASPRAPCRQVYAHHLLLASDCIAGDDCPCENGDTFCAVPAIVEVAPAAGLDMLIIPDDNPTLQALRTELRPDQQEVDGILGTSALLAAEIDIDYPHDRVLARCTTQECVTRPALPAKSERARVNGCVAAGPIPPITPPVK
jgi:hypothetical protein